MRQICSFTSISEKYKIRGPENISSKIKSALIRRGMFLALTMALFFFTGVLAMAETYYSQGSVAVNNINSWNTLAGGGGLAPVDFTGTHTWIIQSGHNMGMTGDWTPGGTATVVIEGGLTVSSTYLVSITGSLTVNGTLTNAGTYTAASAITATGGITVNGTYNHNQNGGYIPSATWSTGSTCMVTGWTSAPSLGNTSFDQPFVNFTWNCPNQSTSVSFAGHVATVPGTFTLINTGPVGSGDVPLYVISPGGNPTYGNYTSSGGDYNVTYGGVARTVIVTNDFSLSGGHFYQSRYALSTLTVGGNYTISAGAHIIARTAGASATVGGNFLMTGGYFRVAYDEPGSLTVMGDFSLTGSGTFNMSDANVVGTLFVAGDFTHTAGWLVESGTGSGAIIFNGTGTQTYTSSRTLSDMINFTVNSGTTLQMATESTVISGDGTFTLSGGGTLGITSANGITADPAVATGNIRTTTARVFSTGANYIYNGTAAQLTGTGLTQNTPANLSIQNSSGVTLSAVTNISNSFSISGGSRVNLGTGLSHTANILILGGIGQPGGSYGGTGSGADHTIPGYFDPASGILNNTCPAGTWLGSTSADWNTAANWSGGVPSAATDAVIASAITNQPVIYASITADCYNLTIDPHALLTIESAGVTSSGSLIVHGTSTGNVTYNRIMPSDLYRYVSSPVSTDVLPTGTTFWRWNEPWGVWGEDVSETPTTACSSGLGYTMLASNNMVSFTGSVVKSTSQTGTAPFYFPGTYANNRGTWGGGGCNLLGNPFTSAMSATTFIGVNGASGNNSLDPNYNAVYIYNGSTYTYIGSQIPDFPNAGPFGDDNIQAGQGFFVFANYNGVPFNFTSAMQTHDVSVPMTKSAKTGGNSWSGVMLKVKYNEKENSTLVVYNEKMTAGLDPGYDVGLFNAGSDVEIYTTMAEKDNSVNFTRQALPIAKADTVAVSVGVDTEKGGEVTFSAMTIPRDGYKFWLEDCTTGIFTDLTTKSYTVTLPAKTYGTGRFFIIASANTPTGIEQPEPGASDIRIWTSKGKVMIKGDLSEKAICEVFNVGGKKILEVRLTGGELNTVNLPSGSNGVFVVRVVDGAKVTTRKVALL